MNSTGYRVLGFAVWNGGKWYLRRAYRQRLRSARVPVVAGLAVVVSTAVTVGAVRRVRRTSS